MAKYHDHYEKVLWSNGATALSAEHMNNLENGISDLITYKVEAESGKGLSTNDYTTAEKTKLSGIEASAEVNRTIATVTFKLDENVTVIREGGSALLEFNGSSSDYSYRAITSLKLIDTTATYAAVEIRSFTVATGRVSVYVVNNTGNPVTISKDLSEVKVLCIGS